MFRNYIWIFATLLVLGEIALWSGTRVDLWSSTLLFLLPLCLVLAMPFFQFVQATGNALRQNISFIIYIFLFLGLLYFTAFHSSEALSFYGEIGFFLAGFALLNALFSLWDHAIYAYFISTFLLMIITSVYTHSPFLWGLYLVFAVLLLLFHSDYMESRYQPKVETTGRAWIFPALCALLTIGVFSLLIVSSNALFTWLDETVLAAAQPVEKLPQEAQDGEDSPSDSQSGQGNDRDREGDKDDGDSTSDDGSDQKKKTSPPLDLQPRVRFGRDLKFGDIREGEKGLRQRARPLFSVKISRREVRLIRSNYGGLFWRGGALDRYSSEKGVWYLSRQQPKKLTPQNGNYVQIQPRPSGNFHRLKLEFEVGAGLAREIFTLGRPFLLFTGSVLRDREGGLNLLHPPQERIRQYSLISYIPRFSRPSQWEVDLSEYRYRTPPPQEAKYRQLARKLTANLKTPFAKAQAIKFYLKKNYAYDLQPRIPEGEDDTEYFLFQSRRGYCQHFASAMALLLRSINIPSRVAIGFRGGHWQPKAEKYTVTTLHGHAWVEVKFEKRGWFPFDPVARAQGQVAEGRDRIIRQIGGQSFSDPSQSEPLPWQGNPNVPPEDFENNPPQVGGFDPQVDRENPDGKKNPDTRDSSTDSGDDKGDKDNQNDISKDGKEKNPDGSPGGDKKDPQGDDSKSKKDGKDSRDGEDSSHSTSKEGTKKDGKKDGKKDSQSDGDGENEENSKSDSSGPKKGDQKDSKSDNERGKGEKSQSSKKGEKEKGEKASSREERAEEKAKAASGRTMFVLWLTLAGHLLVLFLLIRYWSKIRSGAKKFYAFLKDLIRVLRAWLKGRDPVEEEEGEEGEVPQGPLMSFLYRRKHAHLPRYKVIELYLEFSSQLERFYLDRLPYQSPGEYAQSLSGAVPRRKREIRELTRVFLAARFSPQEITESEVEKVRSCIETIGEAIEKRFSD